MPKEPKNLPIRRNLPLHFILNLRPHKRKLLLHFIRMQITTYPNKLATRLLDLPTADELTRGIRHEGDQPQEHDNAPRDLDTERESPLDRAVGGVATGVAHPVRGHSSE